MTNSGIRQSPLTFPSEFDIKVFGIASDEFEKTVITIIRHDVRELRENALHSRLSKDGKYLALTITITAESREQLDNIYRALNSSPLVLMTL